MPTTPEQFAALKRDPEKYAAYKAKMRAAWKKHAAKRNVYEARREKYFRFRGRGKAREEESAIRWAGLSVVSARQIDRDDTVFRHHTAPRTEAISELADRFLAGQISHQDADRYASLIEHAAQKERDRTRRRKKP